MKITIDETGRLTGVFLESKGNVPENAIDVSDQIGSALSLDQEYARYVNGGLIYLERPSDESIAFSVLRSERNLKLAETDWWCASDQNPTQAQLDYRTALRDLPSNSSPSLDENRELTGVTWPTKPE
tara:strand:+ start:1396 stop:1776 length:381 start_codon:yes stop_codon:yes gene_type:complete